MGKLAPKNAAEAIAVFRSQVIGPLVAQELTNGRLKEKLLEISNQRFRPPNATKTRSFSIATLQRWYYAYKHEGLKGLHRQPRKDRGRAKALTEAERGLLTDMRVEHPTASAELILQVLADKGSMTADKVSATTLRRLYRERGLDRVSMGAEQHTTRRRWVAGYPGAIFQGDVCHGATLTGNGHPVPLRIHGLIDDYSRFCVNLRACSNEQEDEMLSLFVATVRRWGAPGMVYLDNGSTYRGETLKTGCARINTVVMHPSPYDPQARGKIERFWRTLRGNLLDHMPTDLTLEHVQERLDIFCEHYNNRVHASLDGKSPSNLWRDRKTTFISDEMLSEALTIHRTRRISKDGVVSIDGKLFEASQRFLAGHNVEVSSCLVGGLPVVARAHWDGRTFELTPLDIKANGQTKREPPEAKQRKSLPLDAFAPRKSR